MSEPNSSKGAWIPLLEFAIRKGISVSTLRRRIKKNEIPFRLEGGRYLFWDPDYSGNSPTLEDEVDHVVIPGEGFVQQSEYQRVLTRVQELEGDLQRAQEEIAELKTLIALYEEKFHSPSRT